MIELTKILNEIGCEYECNCPIAPYTSFKIGGSCKLIVKPKTITELKAVLSLAQNSNEKYFIMGNGSNLLASDLGYDGTVILLNGNFSGIELLSDTRIQCLSGISLMRLCRFALEKSLSGIEFAYGIPGTVGGAIYMNAGAYGGEIKDVLFSCDYIKHGSLELITCMNNELDFSYRHSIFSSGNDCIVSAQFELCKGNQADIKALMDEFMSRRKEKQPLEYPSAGSTFKRPHGGYASALIEQCGLKGFAIGGACVSEKHSGFIVNKGNAACDDVVKLIKYVQEVVLKKTGVKLEPEVKALGFELVP